MSKATPFKALGAGNGFPACLPVIELDDDDIILNAPTLEETMNAYWNFKSATFGGATFEPDSKPKDLASDKTLNLGSASVGDDKTGGSWTVSNAFPSQFVDENNKLHYKHGISMRYLSTVSVEENGGGKSSTTEVRYFSALYTVPGDLSPYVCADEEYCTGPDECSPIGKSAIEKTQSISQVTIGGIPFIKEVIKRSSGTYYRVSDGAGGLTEMPPCPVAAYPAEPAQPTLTLHTY